MLPWLYMYVASVRFKCFICFFRHMLQVCLFRCYICFTHMLQDLSRCFICFAMTFLSVFMCIFLQLFQALVRSSSCLLGTPYQSLQSSNYVLTQLFITLIMSASTDYFVYSKLWSLFKFLCHSSTCI
jgi:hypothetical protein